MANISDGTRYLYSAYLNSVHISKVKDDGQQLNYVEQDALNKSGYADGYDGNWITVDCTYSEDVTVEELTVEQIVQLFNGGTYGSGIPASEIQKWAEAHGVTDLNIESEQKEVYTTEHVTFTFEGKTYDMTNVSYETANSYESITNKQVYIDAYRNGDSKIQVIDVSTPQELQKAMKEHPDDAVIYINADLDMSGVEWESVEKFSGLIFGGNHTISNLNIKGDGDAVGFVNVLTGAIQDLTFDNITVKNGSKDSKSSTGVVAGKLLTEFNLKFIGDAQSLISEVHVTNSSVTGGANAGMIVGDAAKGAIESCSVHGCTVSGDYANGGIIGHCDGTYVRGAIVNNIIINGGQWAGGVVGSADHINNNADNTYNPSYSRIGAHVDGVTINGGYGDQPTLGAGGLFGRCGNTEYSEDYRTFEPRIGRGTNVTINNAYASGNAVGWVCDLDKDGKVIRNGINVVGTKRGDVGRAGVTELENVQTFGSSFNMQDDLMHIAEFARKNGLKELPNIKGVYEDSNGVLYFLNGMRNGETGEPEIGCSDYDNSIEAYKEMQGHMENRGYDTVGLSLIGWDVYPEILYILSQEGATNVVCKRDIEDKKDENGKKYGEEAFEEVYYQKADGSWHKLTTSLWGNTDVRDPKYENAKDLATKGLYGGDLKELKYEDYKLAFQGTPDNIQLLSQLVEGGHYGCPVGPHFALEDMTYEQVAAEIGVLAGQPPYNSGYNDGDDTNREVEDVKPDQLYIEGIDLDPNAKQTYETVRDMLILSNFLNADTFLYTDFGADPDDNKLARIGDLLITKDNWQEYKDLVPMYNKEQLVEKVLDKLLATSYKLAGQNFQDYAQKPYSWVTSLINAMGGTYTGFQTGKNELSQFGSGANSFGYVSFELDGTSYTIPVYANNGKIPGKEQICTKEQIDELAKYMSAGELDMVKYFWFTPLVSVDGEVQSYMFSWESNVMYGRGAATMGMITPKDHTMFSCYDDLLDYVKSNPELYGRTSNPAAARGTQTSGAAAPQTPTVSASSSVSTSAATSGTPSPARANAPKAPQTTTPNTIPVEEDEVVIIDPEEYVAPYTDVKSNGIPNDDYTQYPAPDGQYPEENYDPYSHELISASKGNTPQQYKNKDMKNIVDRALDYIKFYGRKDDGYLHWMCDFDVNENNIGETIVTYGKDFEDAVKKWLTDAVNDLESNGFKYEPNNAFKNRQLYKLLFNRGDYFRPYDEGEREAYLKDLHEYIDNPSKFNELIQNFRNALGLDSNGQGKLEDVFDVLSGKSDEYYVDMARGNTFLLNLKEQYPRVYEEYGSAMDDFTPRIGGTLPASFNGKTRVDMYLRNVLYDDTIRCYFDEVLAMAAGFEEGDSNSVKQEKLRSIFEKVGITKESDVEFVDSIELMQYLLGSDDGVNWFETLMNKKEARAEEEKQTEEYLSNYDSEHSEVSIVPISVPADKIPDSYVSTSMEGVYLDTSKTKISLCLWDQDKGEFTSVTLDYLTSKNLDIQKTAEDVVQAIKSGRLNELTKNTPVFEFNQLSRVYCVYAFGLNATSEQGVYEKDGKFYVFTDTYDEYHQSGDRYAGHSSSFPDGFYLPDVVAGENISGRFNDIFTPITRNLAPEYPVDPDIKVEETPSTNPTTFLDNPDLALVKEISEFIKELTTPVYEKYWEMTNPHEGSPKWLYFDEGEGSSVDSAHYDKQRFEWKSEEDRKACLEEFNKIGEQIMAKFGDKIKSLVFDGEKFIFTTDGHFNYRSTEGTAHIGVGQNEVFWSYLYDGTLLSGTENGRFTAHVQEALGTEKSTGEGWYGFGTSGLFEGCTDKPVIYTPLTVYSGNVPDEMPVDPNGGTFIKTGIEGVIVSTAGKAGEHETYVWDERNQQYVKAYVSILDAMNGYAANFSGNGDPEVTAICIATLYGYNQTSDPYIFEKDGKFFTIDGDTLNKFTGTVLLVESELFSEVLVTHETHNSSASKPAAARGTQTSGAAAPQTPIAPDPNPEPVVVPEPEPQPTAEAEQLAVATASQIDDITVSDISDKMSVTGGCRVYESYDSSQLHPEWREGEHSCENNSVWFWNDDCFGRVPWINLEGFDEWNHGLIKMNYDRHFYIEDILFKAIPLYFGHESCNPNDLTDEEIQYVNAHPEFFHAVLNKRKDGAVEVAVDYQILVATSSIMSADESYYWTVEDFKNKLYGGSKHNNLLGAGLTNAIYAPSVDGNNVVFDDDAIQRIYDRIQEIKKQGYSIYDTSGYVQGNNEFKFLRNLNIQMDDSVDAIREKIAVFCNSLGSSDGKTIHIEDYYAVVPGNSSYEDFVKESAQWSSVLQSRCNDYNKVFGSITDSIFGDITQISRDFAYSCACNTDMLKDFLIQNNGGLFYSGGRTESTNQTGGVGSSGSVGGTTVVNSVTTTNVPSDDYTQEELDAIKQEQYNILIDEIKNSTVYSDYATRYKDLPFYYINCFAYLYTQVGLDANNNVLLDDNFKEQLKQFFLACADYSKQYPSSIYDTYFNSTFGPTLKLLGIEEGSLKSEDFTKLANDSAGLDQVIANMRSVIGVSDGEPITIDKYYAALAKCGVGHETNPQLYTVERATYSSFYTEEAFIEATRLRHFLEDYKNCPSYDPYFVSEFTHPYPNGGNTLLQGSDMISPPGTLRTDEIIDLILEDTLCPYRGDLLGVIEVAAGISVDDKPSVKTAKLKALFKSLNYTPLKGAEDDFVTGYVNGVDLYRYLLGNNPENIDYFATQAAMWNSVGNSRQEKEDWLKSNPTVDYDYDSSIPIDDYSYTYLDKISFRHVYFETQTDADKAEEIFNYIADLVAPLYNKWYEKLGANNYKYFTDGAGEWYDVDSDYYAKRGLVWKNDSDRENCYNEFAAVAQQIIEKYGDLFSSFTFDGEKFVYTLKNAEGVFTPTVENTGNMYYPFDKGYFEASCDNPVSFLPVTTYTTNPPEALPVDEDGGTIVKTDYEGILVSTTGNIYLWDEIEQKYWKFDGNSFGYPPYQVASEILNGNCEKLLHHTPNLGLDTSMMNYIDLLAYSLIYGYNRTSSPNIFEKDGVYYTIDENRLRNFGIEPLKIVKMETPTTIPTNASRVEISDNDFGGEVDETSETTEEPKELMTSEDYKHEAQKNVEELQKKVGNVINNNGLYYNVFNEKTYCYVWNPYEHKWLTFAPNDITSDKAKDSANKALTRIQRILAVLKQGLIFTTNPNVCKDKDGNYYDYNEKTGRFEKRA